MRTENLSIKNMVEISDDKHREEMLHQKSSYPGSKIKILIINFD